MKIAVLSSLAKNTGCWLRAGYLANSLKDKCDVEIIEPLEKSMPFMFDMFLSIPLNIIKVIRSKADFFIGIKPFPNITIPLLIAKIFKGKKIAVDIDDLDFGYRQGLISQISALVQKPFPRFFDLVTYHNDLLKEHIQKEFGVNKNKIYKLDQGVDLSVFNESQKNGIKNTLFYMGHLNVASDLDDIIKAVKLVQNKDKYARFLIVGGGPDEQKFRALTRKLGVKAEFTGHLPKEETAKKLKEADICLVYYKETTANKYRCSMKIRECLAAGKKIVCNNYGDLKAFEKYTYQSSSNIKDFADKILEVMKKGDKREEKGAQYIRTHLNWANIGREFYKKVISICK